jgi:hypothetical protein
MPTRHILFIVLTAITFVHAQTPAGLAYSGKFGWDEATGTVTFASSGSMTEGKEEFFWTVPPSVKQIVIGKNVTVKGGFRVSYRSVDNPLQITGEDEASSIIAGTDEEAWTTNHNVPDHEKWKYGTVSVLADATVHVSQLTSLNPRGYHISGYAKRSVIHVSHCKLLDRRAGHNNNSDGFIGSAGSSITDSFISTGDDAIKAYQDITIRNVVIEHHRNGAPIQLGWGGENAPAKVQIENFTIKGVSPDGLYNMAPITWEAGSTGVRDISIRGLTVNGRGKLYDEESRSWLPFGLFELKPKSCTANITITQLGLEPMNLGVRRTAGIITIDGKPAP